MGGRALLSRLPHLVIVLFMGLLAATCAVGPRARPAEPVYDHPGLPEVSAPEPGSVPSSAAALEPALPAASGTALTDQSPGSTTAAAAADTAEPTHTTAPARDVPPFNPVTIAVPAATVFDAPAAAALASRLVEGAFAAGRERSPLLGMPLSGLPLGSVAGGDSGVPIVTLAPVDDREVDLLLQSLTLRQRIGQRFITWLPGDRFGVGIRQIVVDATPAGFILYPWNVRSAAEVRSLTDSLAFLTSVVTPGIGPLIAADQEGGRVQTFRSGDFAPLPSAAAMARAGSPDSIRSTAYATALGLRSVGVTMNFAPVLDLHPVADRSIIGDRSYGGDAEAVLPIVGPYLSGMADAGVIATAKHFPGHGVTTVDSHGRLPVVATTLEELRASHLIPFAEAVRLGVPAVMTGHLLFEAIDPLYPATLSDVFLRQVLRNELGFTGVVVTDGLEMAALADNFGLEETLVRLFRNDVDLILLYSRYDVVELVGLVEQLVRRGAITEDDVDRGVRRVLALKLRYGLAAVR